MYEREQWTVEPRGVERGDGGLDHAILLQPPGAFVDRGRRQKQQLAQFGVSPRGVFGEQREQLAVGVVERGRARVGCPASGAPCRCESRVDVGRCSSFCGGIIPVFSESLAQRFADHLPVAVNGRLSTKRISRGYSCAARRVLTCCWISRTSASSPTKPGVQHHERHHDLRAFAIRRADHGRHRNSRMTQQRIFDRSRPDSITGARDHVVATTDEADEAVRVARAEVAGHQKLAADFSRVAASLPQ
jgi:hypothetical protein